MKQFPDNFPPSLVQVPATNVDNLKENPWEAIFTYVRTDCQRCHVGVKGRDKRGDYRGMGCAACQQITTVIAPDGEVLVNNKIWRTAAGVEGGGDQGQRGLDMAPAAPHTVDWRARECTSCHAQTKALGYGTHDGRYLKGMFIAANLQIFGPLVGIVVVLLFVVVVRRKKAT